MKKTNSAVETKSNTMAKEKEIEKLHDILLKVHGYLLIYDDELIKKACSNFLSLGDKEKVKDINNLDLLVTNYERYKYSQSNQKDLSLVEYYEIVGEYIKCLGGIRYGL